MVKEKQLKSIKLTVYLWSEYDADGLAYPGGTITVPQQFGRNIKVSKTFPWSFNGRDNWTLEAAFRKATDSAGIKIVQEEDMTLELEALMIEKQYLEVKKKRDAIISKLANLSNENIILVK
jgi:hypothetical protein